MPHGYRAGYTFVAPVIEMPAYLAYLTDRPAKAGGMEEATTRPPNRTHQQRMVTPQPYLPFGTSRTTSPTVPSFLLRWGRDQPFDSPSPVHQSNP